MTTSAARNLQLGGLQNKFSGAATRTDFGTAAGDLNVTLLIQPTSVTALQTLTGDATTTMWAGPMTINNTCGLQPSIKFTGGNFRVLSAVTFTAGQVEVNGVTLFVGGQLAPFIGAGNFTNTAGYITTAVGANNGFISMNGNAAQTTAGTGQFANFEVDNNSGATPAVNITAAADFVGTFNLTNGQVGSSGNVQFNNITIPPTIVVNGGTFNVAPTFTSTVNVYYIGIDKATGNELPTAATKLNDLTVATTNGGIVAGQGVVNVGVATTVNGTLDIFPGQALLLNGVSLTMNGPTITLNGDLANTVAGAKLIFAAATGTIVTGSGVLPDITVNAGSVGNSIVGSVGLATGLLGVDNLRGGGNDLNPGGTGGISYAGGTASSLKVAFGTANTTTGTHLATVTTAALGTFTLDANLLQAGTLTNASTGVIDVGTFIYQLNGAGPHLEASTASIIGTTGTLRFQMGAATALTMTGAAGTIAANVEVKNPLNVASYTLTLGGFNLTLSGKLTLTAGGSTGLAKFDVGAFTLTCTGTDVIMGSNTSFLATGGVGVLKLNAAVAPLTLTYAGSVTIVNLTMNNDVKLAGSSTPTLTITGIFAHVAGDLNFGAIPLTVSGTYTRTAGTYTATTGYFIFSGVGANFQQGNTAFNIPNLRLSNAAAASATGTGVLTVTGALDCSFITTGTTPAGFKHTVSSAPTLAVANGATVNYTSGDFDVVPTYGATIALVATSAGPAVAVDATVWPSSATLVTTFTVTTAGGNVTLPGDRTVNSALYLTNGTLTLVANTLTMVDNSTVYRQFNGAVTNTTGALAYGNNMTVVYRADAAGGPPAFQTGIELPATIANLTFTRAGDVINGTTEIMTAVTVTGTLTIKNDVTSKDVVTGLPPVIPVNVSGNLIVATDAFAKATPPAVTISTLAFNGGSGTTQQFTLAGNLAIANLTLNKAAGGMVYLTGGNLTITNVITFINGMLVMDTVTTPSPVLLLTRGNPTYPQGFDHVSAWVYPNLSHVVGFVQHAIPTGAGAGIINGRFEFPVGSKTGYRPAAITFTNTYPSLNPTNVLVKSVDGNPDGTYGFAIDGGNGIKIGNYPSYYWLMQASPSSFTSTQAFDLDLQGTNLNYPFTSPLDLRIIRRQDGNASTNPWQLQGTAASYVSNYIQVPVGQTADSLIFVRSTSLQGSIVQQLTRFTIGIPVRPPVWSTAANVNPAVDTMDAGMTHTLQFTALTQNSSLPTAQQAITYAIPSGLPAYATINASGLVTLHPTSNAQAGAAPLTVTATDIGGTITMTTNLYVWIVNSAPAFKPTNTITVTGVTDKAALSLSLYAADPDSATQTVTYSFLSITPAAAVANPTVTGHALAWAPTFADAATSFVIKVLASDGITSGHGPTPGTDTLSVNVAVARSRARGDVDGNTHIQAADASYVLQYAVHLPYLAGPPQQSISSSDPAALWAADANNSGTIAAYDAALILQVAAGMPNTLPNVANADAHLGKAITVAASGDLSYSAPQPTSDNMVVNVPLKVAKAANVYAVQLTSRANMDQLSIEAVNMTLPEGWDMKWNVVGNELRIAMAGATQLASGDLGSVTIRLKSKESRLSFSTEAMLNENVQAVGAVEIAAIPTVFALELELSEPLQPQHDDQIPDSRG